MSTDQFNLRKTMQPDGFIRQHHSALVGLHQLTDVLLVWGLLAFSVNLAGNAWEVSYQIAAFLSSLSYHMLAYKNGLYLSWRGQSLFQEVKTVFVTWSLVLGALLTVVFLFELSESYGGGVMVAWSLAVPTAISFYRISARIVLREMRRTGVNTRKIVIVGAKEPGVTLATSILQSRWMGMDIAGFYDNRVTVGSKPLDGVDL